MRLSASKNVHSRLSRLTCGSSNLHCLLPTPDLCVRLKSSAGCFLGFPTVNSTRNVFSLSVLQRRCTRSVVYFYPPSRHSSSSLYFFVIFSKPTCLRRSSLFNARLPLQRGEELCIAVARLQGDRENLRRRIPLLDIVTSRGLLHMLRFHLPRCFKACCRPRTPRTQRAEGMLAASLVYI